MCAYAHTHTVHFLSEDGCMWMHGISKVINAYCPRHHLEIAS